MKTKNTLSFNNSTTIHRVEHSQQNPFSVISMQLINDKRLSVIDLGIMTKILSNSDEYILNITYLQKISGVGKTQFNNSISHLKELGYLKQKRVQSGVVWEIFEVPTHPEVSNSITPVFSSIENNSIENNSIENNNNIYNNLEKTHPEVLNSITPVFNSIENSTIINNNKTNNNNNIINNNIINNNINNNNINNNNINNNIINNRTNNTGENFEVENIDNSTLNAVNEEEPLLFENIDNSTLNEVNTNDILNKIDNYFTEHINDNNLIDIVSKVIDKYNITSNQIKNNNNLKNRMNLFLIEEKRFNNVII